MKPLKVIAAAALSCAGVVAAVPVPAMAQIHIPVGTYQYKSSGKQTGVWTMTGCGVDCLHISSTQGFSSDAHSTGLNLWSFGIDTVPCDDGRRVRGTTTYGFNSETLQGSGSNVHATSECGKPGETRQFTFTLRRQ